MVGISTRIRAGQSGVRIPVGANIFIFSKMSSSALGPLLPPVQWVPGYS